ncbi:hypothetical protein Mal64_19430 [Pseudobythopirellula maris]|uniref:Serpin (Serine protease inhibitor) n=1 Tax=Pseudobythopirellula maris TaxID=2527991 RepID=A0A5C5ZNW6_9BACT|nr:hypothetical protein [Pseudobythopirellula maris]TWT88461.1 hypothetical protein Mal64_19430 [Pseudobythopirellula maris]
MRHLDATMAVGVAWVLATAPAITLAGSSEGQPIADRLPQIRDASGYQRTDVLPHLEGEIVEGRNHIYCATMKLAWDAVPGIRRTDTPMTRALDRLQFSRQDLDATSYYIGWGRANNVQRRLARSFPSVEFPIDGLTGRESISLAYLAKQLPFRTRFNLSSDPIAFESSAGESKLKGFGVEHFSKTEKAHKLLSKQVSVLDYQNEDDFTIELHSRSLKDRILLAKVAPKKTMRETLSAMQHRIAESKLKDEEALLQQEESLLVPVVSLGVRQNYPEIELPLAFQIIQFRLDESGAVLKSFGGVGFGSLPGDGPRSFVFDKPFLLCLVERGSDNPYLAMWIANEELLETAEEN